MGNIQKTHFCRPINNTSYIGSPVEWWAISVFTCTDPLTILIIQGHQCKVGNIQKASSPTKVVFFGQKCMAGETFQLMYDIHKLLSNQTEPVISKILKCSPTTNRFSDINQHKTPHHYFSTFIQSIQSGPKCRQSKGLPW